MIYEITNPSDAYTMVSDDFHTAAAAVLILGEGAYGLRGEDDAPAVPVFLLGGADEWLQKQGLALEPFITAHRGEIAAVLDSVQIGSRTERAAQDRVLACISDEGERAKARAAWHDARRSSMNDIGRRARMMAARLRAA